MSRPLPIPSSRALVLSLSLALPAAATAAPLLAVGSLSGLHDKSGLTGTLENGLPADVLGGMGSALAWAGGSTFIALPDRGPNATVYNPAVDNTASYISRFHTLQMDLKASAGGALPFTLTPTLQRTTLLSSPTALNYGSGAAYGLPNGAPAQNTATRQYFTGRSDGFDPAKSSLNPDNARLDPEGARVSNDGKSVFISDEYGPYVYQFDRATGQRLRSYALPAELGVKVLGTTTAAEDKPVNSSGRVANKGMEGLALTPDGKTLVGVMQAPLLQDSNKVIRIVTIDVASGTTRQYAYQLTEGSGVSEILALNDHEFILDERDGAGLGDGSAAKTKKLFKIDLAGATDISGRKGDLRSFAVKKSLFLDVAATLIGAGVGITAETVPAKIEGLSWGEDLVWKGQLLHTLWVANDNDFLPEVAGTNNFYVFGISDADLKGSVYQPQGLKTVPEPASLALALSTLLLMGGVVRRQRGQGR
ncbi:esterase-like activity of phytase family protein [Roseateles sp. DB2]|uniref:esterase-like activity of phytase family protein n=1 Tax=Roseateles sp. DB2 TaxID=3453717 RepID=UPI003EE8CA9F